MKEKFLCVCQYGHSRSVCLCRVLHQLGETAVAVGWKTGGDALPHLADWATKICILEEGFRKYIPEQHHGKIVVLDVGHDRWANPYHPELHQILANLVNEKLGL